MCDPLTIGGIALTGLSTGINYAASQKVEAARDDAMTAEHLRQQQLDREAAAVNAGTRQEYKHFDKQEGKRGKQLGDYFVKQKAEEDPVRGASLPTSASNVTVSEEKNQRANATDFTRNTGEALGQLRSFGDILGDKSITQAQDASQIGQLSGFKTGSSAVLPYELDDANHVGDSLKFFGDLAGGIGGLVTSKGLSTPGAAPAFKPTTTLGDLLGGAKPFVPNSTIGDVLGVARRPLGYSPTFYGGSI